MKAIKVVSKIIVCCAIFLFVCSLVLRVRGYSSWILPANQDEESIIETEHMHDWVFSHRVESSCTEHGYDVSRCICGEEMQSELRLTPHNWTVEIVQPTCVQPGYTKYVCDCGKVVITDEQDIVSHVWSKEVITEPTCKSGGYTTLYCVCGESKMTEITPKVDHTWILFDTIKPTCTDAGYSIYKCECGEQMSADWTEKLYHSWGNWSVVKAPTENEDGSKVRSCWRCGAANYDSMPRWSSLPATYVGRWVMPNVGVNVAIYRQYRDEGGPIVDAVDSATFFYTSSNCMVIGDHNNQGFEAIKRSSVGDTARIEQKDGSVRNFVCHAIVQGHNMKRYLSDLDGNNLYDVYPGALLCYTCNESSYNVTIVVFYEV